MPDTIQTTKDAEIGEEGAAFGDQGAGVMFAHNGMVMGSYATNTADPPNCVAANDGLVVFSTN